MVSSLPLLSFIEHKRDMSQLRKRLNEQMFVAEMSKY